MNKDQIKELLITWSNDMLDKYEWLCVKYEFSTKRGVYLVSFSPKSQIELSDEFNIEAMRFEDELYDLYGDNAPLFPDEDELFELSDTAEIIENPHAYASTKQLIQPLDSVIYTWSTPSLIDASKVNSNCHPSPEENIFASAA